MEDRTGIDKEEVSTNEPVEREINYPSVEIFNVEKYAHFEELTIPGDYSDYDVLEEEQETISLNDIVG